MVFGGRWRLETGLGLSTAALVAVVIGATMLLVHSSVQRTLRDGVAEQAVAVAKSIGAVAQPKLLAYDYVALQIAAEQAAEDSTIRYVILHDKEDEVAGFAGTDFQDGVIRELKPGWQAGDCQEFDLLQAGGSERVLEAIVPVYVEDSPEAWGTVRVGLSLRPVLAQMYRLRWGMALIGLAFTALAVVASRLAGRWLTAPLRDLVEATEALASGSTSHRLPATGTIELAELGQSFNRMLERLQEKADESDAYQEELARLNATLEEQVLQRTLALEESEKQYRTLVDCSPDAIAIVQQGELRFVNRAFVETFGVPSEQALTPGFDLERLFDGESGRRVRRQLQAWEEGEAADPTTIVGVTAEGEPLDLELRGSRIEYRGASAAECLFVNMTQAIQLRKQLEDTARLRSLGELSSGVAHDFNNLLSAILGRSQMLRQRDLGEEFDRDLAVIETAARDGRETVRRIQEFARVQQDRPVAAVDVREAMLDAVEITRTRWKSDVERRNVRIELVQNLDDVPKVAGNITELRELFTNLILNAVDAMPQGGELGLSCQVDDERVCAQVADTGVGMTEEIRRHLYDPFFTTKGVAGTGLGMSVVYGIVQRHGGAIEVDSQLGRGSTFRVHLPIAPARACEEGLEQELEALTEAPIRARVLVIDDEHSIAQLLDDALSAAGYTVEVAVSGGEGVQRASLARFDLVLTDLGMPDMSGWEVAGRIHEVHPDLPIMLVTGWGATIDEDEVAEAGIAGVVHKPFEIDELLQATSRVLRAAIEAGHRSL